MEDDGTPTLSTSTSAQYALGVNILNWAAGEVYWLGLPFAIEKPRLRVVPDLACVRRLIGRALSGMSFGVVKSGIEGCRCTQFLTWGVKFVHRVSEMEKTGESRLFRRKRSEDGLRHCTRFREDSDRCIAKKEPKRRACPESCTKHVLK